MNWPIYHHKTNCITGTLPADCSKSFKLNGCRLEVLMTLTGLYSGQYLRQLQQVDTSLSDTENTISQTTTTGWHVIIRHWEHNISDNYNTLTRHYQTLRTQYLRQLQHVDTSLSDTENTISQTTTTRWHVIIRHWEHNISDNYNRLTCYYQTLRTQYLRQLQQVDTLLPDTENTISQTTTTGWHVIIRHWEHNISDNYNRLTRHYQTLRIQYLRQLQQVYTSLSDTENTGQNTVLACHTSTSL